MQICMQHKGISLGTQRIKQEILNIFTSLHTKPTQRCRSLGGEGRGEIELDGAVDFGGAKGTRVTLKPTVPLTLGS